MLNCSTPLTDQEFRALMAETVTLTGDPAQGDDIRSLRESIAAGLVPMSDLEWTF